METINKIKKEAPSPLLIVIIFVDTVGFFVFGGRGVGSIQSVNIAEQNIKVDLALTPDEHAQGLSGRVVLEEDEGMLFVFDQPDKYFFG